MKHLRIHLIIIITIAFNIYAESEIMGQWQALTNYNKNTIISEMNQFLTNCTKNQLLQLCEGTSKMIDVGTKTRDSFFEIYMFINALSDKGDLSSEILLNVILDHNAPKTWQRIAMRFLGGAENFLDLSCVDFQPLYNVFINIINDENKELSYRKESAIYFTSFLENKYTWIYAPEKAKNGDVDYTLSTIIATGKLLEHDKDVDIYMNFINNMLVLDNIPAELKQSTLKTAIDRLTCIRGTKTPGLAKIKKTLESLVPQIPEITIAKVDPITSNKITNLEKLIENGSDKAPQLRKTQERILQQAATKDFTDSQKTYLSTLNTINKYLSENQN